MEETKMGTEKRQYPRAGAHIPVRYRKRDDVAGTPVSGSLTGDISAGGLRFRTKELISAACNLILELDLPTLAQPILATSKVAWINNNNTGKEYEVGNEFMEISKRDQELIAQYVNRLR